MVKHSELLEIEKARILAYSLKNANSEKDQLKAVKSIAKYIGMMNKKLAEDKRAIMQRFGYGVVEVALILKNLAENAQSESVRLQAIITNAKCLGMM